MAKKESPLMEVWLLIVGVYAVALVVAALVWGQIRQVEPTATPGPSITVLVPARNEAERILPLLNDLSRQQYAGEWEVLVIDDHSEDETVAEAESLAGLLPLTVLSLRGMPGEPQGKKAALAMGVAQARGEIIVTTDADCRVGPHWLATLTVPLREAKAQMVFGPVTYAGRSFWGRVQAIEFWSLQVIGAVSWQLGKPSMCNGANLAFRKSAMEAVGGYQPHAHVASGDDEFTLHAIREHFGPQAVQFQQHSNALVHTQPVASLGAFLMQRRRWAGKWNLHQSATPRLMATGVFAFHAVVVLGWVALALGTMPWQAVALGFGLKLVGEAILLGAFSRTYRLGFPIAAFVWWQVLYSLYALGMGLIVQRGTYQWKGRTYDR